MSDTENSTLPQEETPGADSLASDGQQLFDTELNAFREAINENHEAGLKRFGFALFHSLPPADRIALMEKLGLCGETALDFYNLGTARALAGDHEMAAQLLEKAVQTDADLAEARFNLALTLRQLGRNDEARAQMKEFSQITDSPTDREAAESFLAELEA